MLEHTTIKQEILKSEEPTSYRPLQQLLEAYHPSHAYEMRCKYEMLGFLTNPHCFERSLTYGHFTASSWLLNKAGTHALLMHHAKLDMWVQLGGHCDGDSDVLSVAIKEAQEESGIMAIEPVSREIFDIDIHYIPKNAKEEEHFHYDVRFLLRVTSDKEIQQNSESKELRWIAKDRVSLPTEQVSVVRMFDKWIELF